MSFNFEACLAAVLTLATPGAALADDGLFQWQRAGSETYANFCGTCHQPDGQGVPNAFPPLVGHAPDVLAHSGGREYLARLVLYGLQGHIAVNGKPFDGAMPAWGEALSDEQLAAALDYVLQSWTNQQTLPADFEPFVPAEIARAREQKMTPEQMYALRNQIMPEPSPAATASMPPQFTQEQADRGQTAYRRNCQDCHGVNLNDGEFGGAPLNGQYFARHWGNGSVAALYGFLRTKMPPDRPGRLSPQIYADLTAFLLIRNGYQTARSELPPDVEAQARMSLRR
jgi:mono/diheme cytochrome c family protein